jgi:hypothetical protein
MGRILGTSFPLDFQAQQMARQQPQRIKVAGYGNGIMSDLGETDAAPVPLDYSRPAVDTPKGKGYYGKDGAVYVKGPDGSTTKILQGYDRDASWEASKRDFERRKAEASIAHENEATASLSAARNIKEDQTSEAYLERKFGKPPKGMRWDASGQAIAIPGGDVEQSAKTAVDTGTETIRKIDEMIGKRDANGNLVEGSKAHPGFSDVVGAKWSGGLPMAVGMEPIGGTDAANFKARLDEIKGGAFLKAFDTLKGGGQITEVEGKKATDAITRMNAAQSEAEFVKAAQEFRDVVQRGVERSQSRAGAPTPPGAAPRQAVAAPPDPAQHAGKIMTDSDTGVRYRSDGQRG